LSRFLIEQDQAINHIELVFDKIKTLIKFGIWGNLSIERFKRWQTQFQTVEKQFYAAYLAQQLIYYNKKDVLALLSYSFSQCMKQVAMSLKGDVHHHGDLVWKKLIDDARSKTLVCPLTTDSAAASGFMVSRMLRNQNIIYEHQLCLSIKELVDKLKKNNYKAIVFVDDMIGSGTQVRETFTKKKDLDKDYYFSIKEVLYNINPELSIFISVAIAPERSIERLNQETGFTVIAAEKLTDRNEVVNEKFWLQDMFPSAMEFLDQIEQEIHIPKFGYDQNSWAVTFEHGTPDNCCPFYHVERNGWTSLIRSRGEDI
jgi:hypothetical protein